MTSYSTLQLQGMVMHQLRKSTPGAPHRFDVLLTDEVIVLQPEDRAFLTTRFVKALSGRGIPIIEDRAVSSEVPGYVRQIWTPGADFVERTKEMASFLAAQQPGSALEGLLVVAEVMVGNEPAILISKVEHQEAMRLEPITNAAGHQVFEVERIRDLVFGDTARIYKVAVIFKAQSATGVLAGEVVDEQNGNKFADYFLGKFLGMRLREEPAVLTERFLDNWTTAINKSSLPPESKLDVQSALVAELQSNDAQLNPTSFVQSHVPNGFGPELRALAQAAGGPVAQFTKDTNRVDSRIRKLRMDLSNGIFVIAPPDLVGPNRPVSVRSNSSGSDVVTITGGTITSVKSSGGN